MDFNLNLCTISLCKTKIRIIIEKTCCRFFAALIAEGLCKCNSALKHTPVILNAEKFTLIDSVLYDVLIETYLVR